MTSRVSEQGNSFWAEGSILHAVNAGNRRCHGISIHARRRANAARTLEEADRTQPFARRDPTDGMAFCPRCLVVLVEDLVLAHLPERLSEAFLSGVFGIEARELRYAFLKVRGAVPYTALHALRMLEVKRRLDGDADLSIEVVMRQCGFGGFYHFRQAFQKKFGVDPRQFRKAGKRDLEALNSSGAARGDM